MGRTSSHGDRSYCCSIAADRGTLRTMPRDSPNVGSRYENHPGLQWLRRFASGRAWLAKLPGLVAESADKWSIRLESPFPYAYCSLAVPGVLPDETPVVLKIQYPDRESQHEAAALRHWAGDGAIQLLAFDPGHSALLLERCLPGTALAELDSAQELGVMIELLNRLLKPAASPFRTLTDEAHHWAEGLLSKWERAGRPFQRKLLEATLDLLATLPESQGEQVLLHQDLHGGNVLRAQRQAWLAIDPKPLVGEREFSVGPVARGMTRPSTQRLLNWRLDRLVEALSLNRERARGWALVQTLAWAFEGANVLPEQVQTALWLLE